MSIEDEELVKKSQEGCKDSFQQLVSRYQRKLFCVAFGMLRNREDGLEVLQEAFLKIYKNIPNFQGNSSFYTWAYRILVNLCIDFHRKERKHYKVELDTNRDQKKGQGDNVWSDARISGEEDPSKALFNRELRKQIMAAMEHLSPAHRSIIVLRELEGMSYEEIAEILECSKGTVMSRLHHARNNLRSHLTAYINRGELVLGKEEPNKKKTPFSASA